jgi:hypothetical protein
MIHLWFLLEEISMENTLTHLLPKIIDPKQFTYSLHKHNGCNDLIKSIPKKISGAKKIPNTYIVVLIDQDNHDCINLKSTIDEMFVKENIEHKLIRIVVRELESWFLGDLQAVSKAFEKPTIAKLQNRKEYRNPDENVNPKQLIKNLFKQYNIGEYKENRSSQEIAPFLDIKNNKSISFKQFINGLNKYILELNFSIS